MIPKRFVYYLEPIGRRGYVLVHRGALVESYPLTKRAVAVEFAGESLARFARTWGQRSELRVRRINGTIGETRTYPRISDPKESKG